MKKILLTLLFASAVCRINAQSLSDGEYYIKVVKTGKYLGILGAGKQNGALAVQWDTQFESNYKFILTSVGNSLYTLKAAHSGLYLSAEGSNPARGSKMMQWDWMNQENQKWIIAPHKSGKGYVMRSLKNYLKVIMQHWNAATATPQNGSIFMLTDDEVMPEMILDFKKNEPAQTTKPPTGNAYRTDSKKINTDLPSRQQTILADVADGVYKIRINESGKYLAIAGQEDMNNGMRLIQWDMLPRNNHLFAIKKLNNGNYTISPVHSQKVLDVVDMRTDDGTQIQQWDDLNGNNQQWKFYNTPKGYSIVSVASGKLLQLSAGNSNTQNGTPLIINSSGSQSFTLLPARAHSFTEYITVKNLRFTVPHGGDLEFYGVIQIYLIDKHGNSYNRYYESPYREDWDSDNILFYVYEKRAIDMDKNRVIDFGGELKFKIAAEEIPGARLKIVYGINENDADVAALFTTFGSISGPDKNPNGVRTQKYSYRGGGSDDFYLLKNSFTNCLRTRLDYSEQYISISDIPASCLVHVNLQDEDGSDNWLDVYYTITKERK